ncbi:MAG TPA: hypothetical protein VG325_08345 [Solirubrobacteraceae bacterium]|nr:hypothetical protein [Solirubrobacteraceae bacterium]
MSDTTLETPDALGSEGREATQPSQSRSGRQPFWRRHVWWLVALAVLVIAEILLRWANTRPGYDPYGWLIWGYQTLHGSLDLGGAPSWKPFSYIPNVVFALFGHYALHLWMLTSVAVSLAGAIFAGRIAYRVTAREGASWWPPVVASVVAGACVLGIQDGSLSVPGTMSYFHYVLSAQSDSMIVTVCLAAIDMFLLGRRSWAWWLGVYAGLGRPEVWPFLAIYGVWILWRKPDMRWMVIAGAVITAFFWFGIPTITNGKPNVAGQLALKSPRELHSNKVVGTLDRYVHLLYLPAEIAALVALGLAVLRRNRTVIVLAGMVALWVATEVGFVLHGFPGVQRYLFEAAGLTGVLAGIAAGWLLLDARRWHAVLPRWAGIPLAVVFVVLCLPHARALADREHKDIVGQRNRTERVLQLGSYVTSLGGPGRIQGCGGALLNVEYVSIMGWYLHKNTGQVAYQPDKVLKRTNPVIYFILLRNGWMVQPLRPQRARTAGCASLKSLYVPTARHPKGVLIPK